MGTSRDPKRKRRNEKLKRSLNKAFDVWCKTISVRGIPKLASGPKILRICWLIYVISMSTLLIFITSKLVLEYFKYEFIVQTVIKLDDPSPFPAFTVCHQHPFSNKGFNLWKKDSVLSPMNFNAKLKKLALKYLNEKNLEISRDFALTDIMRLYFQSLNKNETRLIGHDLSIFLSCIRSEGGVLHYEQDCSKLDGYKIKIFSHHKYFNCFTFEPASPEVAIDTNFLALIISMGPQADENEMERAFLTSIFDQNDGLRVVVHEAGTYPDLAANGINVEPRKLNEIAFTVTRRIMLDVPTRRCKAKKRELLKIDNVTFNYSQDLCQKLSTQREVIHDCDCIYALNPWSQLPNKTLPYCERIYPEEDYLRDYFNRSNCVKAKENSKTTHLDEGKCIPNCFEYHYPHTTSITGWHTHGWQMYWLSELRKAYVKLTNGSKNTTVPIDKIDGYKLIRDYLTKENISIIDTENPIIENEDCAFVVLKRLRNNTDEVSDSLTLNIATLLSRIGGLSSITIGLTASVVVELLEFIYKLCNQQKTDHQDRPKSASRKRSKNNNKDNFVNNNNNNNEAIMTPEILSNPSSSPLDEEEMLQPLGLSNDERNIEKSFRQGGCYI